MIIKIKRKVFETEACQFTGENDIEINRFTNGLFERNGHATMINKPAYRASLYKKDWIVKYSDHSTRIVSDIVFANDYEIIDVDKS